MSSMFKISAAAIVAAAALFPASLHAEISFIDHAGKTITFKQPPERVVTIVRSAPILYRALDGKADNIVGMNRDSLTRYFTSGIYTEIMPEMSKISTGAAQDGFVPNVEAILQDKPDAVIQWITSPDWLIKRHFFVANRIVTDKFRSYGAAKREVAPGLDHWSHKGLNNRGENSLLPFRKRERAMQGHRLPGGLQRFVVVHSATRYCFQVPFRRRSALTIRNHRLEAFDGWKTAASIARSWNAAHWHTAIGSRDNSRPADARRAGGLPLLPAG